MKALDKELRGFRCLVFLDLEGTQFTSQIIEIGAVKVLLKDDGSIKKVFDPFRCYVKPTRATVGKRVSEITGLTDKFLQANGVSFGQAQESFKKYVGKYWTASLFVTFGTYDSKMISESARLERGCSKEDAYFVNKRTWDLQGFIAKYIRDEHGNPYSVDHYLEVLGAPFEGKHHDAADDAYNTYRIYKYFLENKDVVREEYKKALVINSKLPLPLRSLISRLNAGESVTPEDYGKAIEEALK